MKGGGLEGRGNGRRTSISEFDDGLATGDRPEADIPGSIDPEVRARYLDFCAARLSEVFLSLSDERTYALMEEAARDAQIEIGSLGFSEMMDLVTARLREDVPLPSLEEFAREYRADPSRFDAVLLEPPDDDPTGSESP